MGAPVTDATVEASAVYQTAVQLPLITLAIIAPLDTEGNKSARLIANRSAAFVTPTFVAPAVPVPEAAHVIELPVLNAVASLTVTVHVPLAISI